MDNIEILHDHYKDTFQYLREYIKQRDKYFLFMIILSIALLFFIYDSSGLLQFINSYIKNKFNATFLLELKILNTLLLFSFLAVSIKYVQVNLLIENQYFYISNIENEMNTELNKEIIQREGQGYLKEYPLVKDLIHYFYTLFIPLFYSCIIIYKIIIELNNLFSFDFFSIMNLLFCSIAVIVFLLYLLHLSRNKKILNVKIIPILIILTITLNLMHEIIFSYKEKFFVNIIIYLFTIILLSFYFWKKKK